MVLEKLNILSKILEIHQGVIKSEANGFYAVGNFNDLEKECVAKGIETDRTGTELSLKLKSFLGCELVSFHQIETYFEYSFIDSEFIIIDCSGVYCYHDGNDKELIFSINVSEKFKTTCTNLFHYFRLYNFLKSDQFSDHHNDANLEIVIYSSANGIFKLKYANPPTIDTTKDISKLVSKLIETVSQVLLRNFFKNALFTFSSGRGYLTLNDVINNSSEIIETTNRDYDLAAKQFDFEKFRNSLYKEKDKYFYNIREIVNKIFGQAVGIPISISATVFATYKVSDDIAMLLIVLFAFILYVIFYIKIQCIYKADIEELNSDFEMDFKMITSDSGLSKDVIDKEKGKVKRKIEKSISMIDWLIIITTGLGSLVIFYVIYQIAKSEVIHFFDLIIRFLFI